MSEKQKTLTLTLDNKQVALTIVRATARVGVERYLLASASVEANKTETSEALKILRLTLYPDLVSTTPSIDGLPCPIEFSDFAELPEDFVNAWAEVVYELNPSWRAMIVPSGEDADAKKKVVKRHKGTSSKNASSIT